MSQLSLFDAFGRGRSLGRTPPPPRMTSAPVTPTRETRQPSQPILDVEDDSIDPDKLEATAAALLDQVLEQRRMPTYLRKWTRAFNEDRRLSFALESRIEEPRPFRCGLPQGSPEITHPLPHLR
jgi:hypothetical protein